MSNNVRNSNPQGPTVKPGGSGEADVKPLDVRPLDVRSVVIQERRLLLQRQAGNQVRNALLDRLSVIAEERTVLLRGGGRRQAREEGEEERQPWMPQRVQARSVGI